MSLRFKAHCALLTCCFFWGVTFVVVKNALIDIVDDVESGNTLSEAFGKHPKCFDRLYVNMVKAGEAGGALETILKRLDMIAHHRGRHVEAPRGRGKPVAFNDPGEHGQACQPVHGMDGIIRLRLMILPILPRLSPPTVGSILHPRDRAANTAASKGNRRI